MSKWTSTVAMAIALGVASPAASALSIGQIDTFETGIENWFAGGGPVGAIPPFPPEVVATGGPGGAGDGFMQITAIGGQVPGGRLVAMNATQWAGDYVAAGIVAIHMDLRNLGTTDLAIRLLFEDPFPAGPQNIAMSTVPVLLPAGGDWVHASFDVTANGLTALLGDVGTLLGDTTLIRIVHAAALAFPGEPVTGLLGVDNIAAADNIVAVDEPATTWLLALALVLVAGCRRPARTRAWCGESVIRCANRPRWLPYFGAPARQVRTLPCEGRRVWKPTRPICATGEAPGTHSSTNY